MGALESLVAGFAGIAQLVERHVANVKVAGSNPVSRSGRRRQYTASGEYMGL